MNIITDSPTSSLNHRLTKIKEKIKTAAAKSGRKAEDILLVAVTKSTSVDLIKEVLSLGVLDLGENRIQEFVVKKTQLEEMERNLRPSLRWHFIGSLQTNKARKAVENFDVIHSVDRPKLAVFLDRASSPIGKIQRCLVEVKVSTEPTKTGCPLYEAPAFIQNFSKTYPHLRLEGLMTIAPMGLKVQDTREYFRRFQKFFHEMSPFLGEKPILSMGMSDDFEIAIEAGSTLVRIGRALFGERSEA